MNHHDDMKTDGMTLPPELLALKRFHGHLGPYVVFGYRMGMIARAAFPKKIHATVFSGTIRPRSCMADGVQMASTCTIGKNNIIIIEENTARAIFTDGEGSMEISVRPALIEHIDKHMSHETEEELSMDIFLMDDDSLFIIDRG